MPGPGGFLAALTKVVNDKAINGGKLHLMQARVIPGKCLTSFLNCTLRRIADTSRFMFLMLHAIRGGGVSMVIHPSIKKLYDSAVVTCLANMSCDYVSINTPDLHLLQVTSQILFLRAPKLVRGRACQ